MSGRSHTLRSSSLISDVLTDATVDITEVLSNPREAEKAVAWLIKDV
jgi:hypothetical protein